MKNHSRLSVDNIKDIYTLSPLQEGIFFNWSLNPASIAYFEQQSVRQFDKLDLDVLQKSLRVLMERHDILRTVFIQKTTDRPIQVVLKETPIDFYFEDLTGRIDKETRIWRYKDMDKTRYFNLSKDILIRLSVFKLAQEEYELIWSWHHILMDAWCVNKLKREFYEIYVNLQENGAVYLAPPVPYRNYIQWLQRQDKDLSGCYWRRFLNGYVEIAEMPFKKTGYLPPDDYETRQLELELDETLSASISTLLNEVRTTQSTFFQVVWGILLARYNNTRDVVFGIVVAGRPAEIEGVEDIMGLFINTIPVRVRFDGTTGFLDLLNEMQNSALESDAHNYYPLAEIQILSSANAPLFDHIFLFQNFVTANAELENSGKAPEHKEQISRYEVFERYFYDFNIFIIPGKKIRIIFKFNGHIYDSTDLGQTLKHYEYLIRSVAKDLHINVNSLSLLSKTEQEELAIGFNPDADRVLSVDGFVSLFERQVAKSPGNIALSYMGIPVTYQALNNKADSLAAYLAERNIGLHNRIGILAHRSDKMIIALLAVLKSGAVFIPVDPETPVERLKYIFKNSEFDYLLTESGFLLNLTEVYQGEIFALDIQLDDMPEIPFTSLITTPEDPAYVIYTSGSTGRPKGVKIRQRSFVNYLLWANEHYFRNEPGYGFALFTSLAFDLTLTSIFTTLLRGDTIWVYAEKDVNTSLTEIFTSQAKANTVKLTPSHINLLQYLHIPHTSVRTVIVGGEALTKKHVQILESLDKSIRIYNEYGPTEATVGCAIKDITGETPAITIGRSVFNTRIYILDDNQHVMPVGINGEICIGGAGLAEGYLNNEAMTRQKFLDDPFKPGERIYLTGDLGKWLADGEIHYSGRKDDQVKVRGYRVELAEIETVAMTFLPVEECVCVLNSLKNTLVLYYKADPGLRINELTEQLKKYLPEYMIPGMFVAVNSFILTSNGKIDRRSLPDPYEQASLMMVAPENEIEGHLLDIWKEVLELESISVEEKFFSIGGHSLKATQVASRILKEFKVKIALQDIFEYQTIRQLAKIIGRSAQDAEDGIKPAPLRSHYPLSHSQRRLWIMYRLEDQEEFYTSPSQFEFDAGFNRPAFENAIQGLIERHEILRTTFPVISDEPVQVIHPFRKENYKVVFRNISINDEQYLIEEARKPFNLQDGPLLRVNVLNVNDQRYIVLFSCHHIISDGWSLEVLIREFNIFYKAFDNNVSPSLEPLHIQYKDYALWHNSFLESKGAEMRGYWLNKLGGRQSQKSLPTDYKRSDKKPGNGSVHHFNLRKEAVDKLIGLSEETGCTLFMSLLACIKVLIHRLCGEQDILIGTPMAGRVRKEMENQIGNYLNIVVLRDEVDDRLSCRELLYQIRTTTTEAYDHQLYPFDLILEDLQYKRQKNRHPLFDVGFTLQSQIEPRTAGNRPEDVRTVNAEIRNYRGAVTDLWFVAEQTINDLSFSLNYDRSLFNKKTILFFSDMLQSIVNDITIDPDIRINEIAVPEKVAANGKLKIKLKI